MKRQLKGKAPKGRYTARTELGTHEPTHGIFPIIKQTPDNKLHFVGTGFFISQNGVFLTAKHVLMDVVGSDGNAYLPIGMIQLMLENSYLIRPITKCTSHSEADIAIGVCAPVHKNSDGSEFRNICMSISVESPTVGARIATYAFPETTVEHREKQFLRVRGGYFDGLIEENHPNGRDLALMPGPCIRTSMHIHGGASGGPVFSDSGAAFAVNSTGFLDESISYITPISAVLDMPVPWITIGSRSDAVEPTLRELIDRRLVAVR